MPRFYNRQEVLNLPNGTLVSYLNREEDPFTYRIHNNELELRLDSHERNSWLIGAAVVDDWYIVGPPRRKPFGDFHDR